jgi:transcriptional regulator with XRE-family HTH domain
MQHVSVVVTRTPAEFASAPSDSRRPRCLYVYTYRGSVGICYYISVRRGSICNSIYSDPHDMLTHMTASLEPITSVLRKARERKGLTQRELGQRVGWPQSHISKIESATVDLQTSSLIELARALDLDVTLIPRTLIPAVQALQRTAGSPTPRSIRKSPNRVLLKATQTLRTHPHIKELGELTALLDELTRLARSPQQASMQHGSNKRADAILNKLNQRTPTRNLTRRKQEALRELQSLNQELRRRRDIWANGGPDLASRTAPAYELDTEDDGG